MKTIPTPFTRTPVLLTFVLYLLSGSFSILQAQDKPAYILYNSKGKKIRYSKLIEEVSSKDILLFGEYHNNAIAHWLQWEITSNLQQKRELILGAEMFEQDNQEALTQYVQGKITARRLDSTARLWKNYPTDYAPLVDLAKTNQLTFTATNIPRKFASLVARGGFEALDTLNALQKSWIAPLPILYDSSLPGYKNMVAMMGGHGGSNLPKAQAIKDATMAHFILQSYRAGTLFIHYNGSYHSD
ncbi:MAG: iron-regulated protein, partial [Sediminibacterium sp.]|nr:iron-regulated protein [Sediminibacterium sp.]